MIQTLRRYITGEKGVAYIEFALVLPILLLLFVGGLELTRFVMVNQKVDMASHGLANFLSMQDEPMDVSASVLDSAFTSLIRPFGVSEAGYRVLELRPDLPNEQADGYPLVVEEDKTSGAAGPTRVGTEGGKVTGDVVRDIRVDSGEFLVAVETYFTYKSIVPGMANALTALGVAPPDLEGSQLYKRSVVRHRLANFELLKGSPTNPSEPLCCGTYCDNPAPSCACSSATDVRTCSKSDGAAYDNCVYKYCPPNPCKARGDCPVYESCSVTNTCPSSCAPNCGGGGG